MWRSKDWENPYLLKRKNIDPMLQPLAEQEAISKQRVYEAGADAMLEDLRKMGNDPTWLLGLKQLFQNHKVVFIPNEEI